jgi:hypothetical protein
MKFWLTGNFFNAPISPASQSLLKTARVFPQGLELFSFRPGRWPWGSPEKSVSIRRVQTTSEGRVPMQRIAIYCRTDAENTESVHAQRNALEARVKEWACQTGKKYEITRIYEDENFSNASLGRPGLTLLREAAREREFDLTVVTSLNRLSCTPSHLFTLGKEFFECGIAAFSLQRRDGGIIEARNLFPYIELAVSTARAKSELTTPRFAAGE